MLDPHLLLSSSPGNAEWLYCKSRVCGVSSVIQDLDQCSQYMDCTETGLVRDTLVLLKPSLDFLDHHFGQFLKRNLEESGEMSERKN